MDSKEAALFRRAVQVDEATHKTIDADAYTLWREYVADVEPLAERKAQESAASHSESDRIIADVSSAYQPQITSSNATLSTVLPALKPASADGVDALNFRRLRKGKTVVEMSVILRGLSKDAARVALQKAIMRACEKKLRCVLVVTGRGRSSPDGVGVIRNALPAWLNEPELRKHVVAFHPAQPHDGGEGAFYVLLR